MRVEQAYNLDIYPERIIMQAINDYRGICNIVANIQDSYAVCQFSHGKTDERTIVLEFSNYLIELLNSRRPT